MGPFPILSDRLILREFRAGDEPAIHRYASDPQVTRYTSWGPNTAADTRVILEGWLEQARHWPRSNIPLAIEDRATGDLLGSTGLHEVDFLLQNAVFGYVLRRDAWGVGFATEASRALLGFGFRTLQLRRMVADCDVDNHASYRIMEKLGMRREAHHRQNALKHGEWRDTYQYAILAEEWGALIRQP